MLPPQDAKPDSPVVPPRVLIESPHTVAAFMRARRRRNAPARDPARRWFGVIGTLLMHMLFLAIFVLGPAYELRPPAASPATFLQVRLIDADELLPPPVHGTPPRQIGPRHQGRAGTSVAAARRTAAAPPAVRRDAVASAAATPSMAQPLVSSMPPASVPVSTPTPALQPVPLAGALPAMALPAPSLRPPVLPEYQPEARRPVREQSTLPIPPPVALAVPIAPAHLPPSVATPGMTLDVATPGVVATTDIGVVRVPVPAAPPGPVLQAIPLPPRSAPALGLPAPLAIAIPTAPDSLAPVHAPAVDVVAAPMQAIPMAPAGATQVAVQPASARLEVQDASPAQHAQIVVDTVAEQPAPPAAATPDAAVPPAQHATAAVAPQQPAPEPARSASVSTVAQAERDVSIAPDATPQGRDDAAPGLPAGAATTPAPVAEVIPAVPAGAQRDKVAGGNTHGTGQLAGETGGRQPGAAQGERRAPLGGYIQLKPHGDTEVMEHRAPDIGYKPTRFEGDWTPEGESSIDTALRHAVEKTTASHTFHLPRGVRIKCAVRPLLPIALLGCSNPDPPPRPVASKVYARLHLAPANPVATPTPAASVGSAPAVIKLDNTAECVTARISGGPPPPGCADAGPSGPHAPAPIPASSSWVPASDQFHSLRGDLHTRDQ